MLIVHRVEAVSHRNATDEQVLASVGDKTNHSEGARRYTRQEVVHGRGAYQAW